MVFKYHFADLPPDDMDQAWQKLRDSTPQISQRPPIIIQSAPASTNIFFIIESEVHKESPDGKDE